MSAEIPTVEPDSITAGDSATWKRNLTDYPVSDGWSFGYVATKAGSSSLTIATTGSGTTYTVALTPEETAEWAAGLWYWQAYATKTGQRKNLGSGRWTVKPNFAEAETGFDPRSFARKALDAIEVACLDGIRDDIEINVDGMALRFRSFDEMLEARGKYQALYDAEVRAERLANGKGSGRKVLNRFICPT